MTTPLCPMSPRPERDELRAALRMLKPLALCKVPGAEAELHGVEALIRDLYPRATKGTPDQEAAQGKRRRRRRKIVEERDCMGLCRACGGPHKAKALEGWAWCLPCRGTGWSKTPVGKAELDPADFYGDLYCGAGPKRTRNPRGEVAVSGGVSPRRPIPPAPHVRGYLGGAGGGVLIGESRAAGALEAPRFGRRIERVKGQPPKVIPGADATDLSSVLEAEAIRQARDGDFRVEGVRGRRLIKRSRRERGILTAGQQKRVRCEDRVRVYAAIENRRLRAGEPRAERVVKDAGLEALRRMGVDVDALMAQHAPAPELDTPEIAEARRRSDLGPDDFLQPHSSELLVRVTGGPLEGQVGHATLGLESVFTVRRDGTVCRGRALRVDLPSGEFDYVHPDDVEACHAAA